MKVKRLVFHGDCGTDWASTASVKSLVAGLVVMAYFLDFPKVKAFFIQPKGFLVVEVGWLVGSRGF